MHLPNATQQPSKWQIATSAAICLAIIWNFLTNWFPPTGVTISKLSNTVFAKDIYNDRVFSGVIIWAIGGIIIANLTSPAIAIGGLLAIAILTIFMLRRSRSL